jgi:hypothetical protein
LRYDFSHTQGGAIRTTVVAAALGLAAIQALAQSELSAPLPALSPAAGVIDLHVHSHPDVFARSLDDIDVAQLAKAKGLRGIVLKNHGSETASRAALVMKAVPGIEVWGGVVLNRAVGGVNPEAVEWMQRVHGGRGKVVWLPTFDSDKHVKTLSRPEARGLVVAPGGQVTPEMEAVLKIIARENLVLGTGHVHPEEIIAVVRRARELGIKSVLINHAFTNVPGLSMAQAKQLVEMGAVIEVCFRQLRAAQLDAKQVARAVKELGARHLVVSSDLGQSGHDGPESAIAELKREGIAEADIDLMMRKNPARLLGLAD